MSSSNSKSSSLSSTKSDSHDDSHDSNGSSLNTREQLKKEYNQRVMDNFEDMEEPEDLMQIFQRADPKKINTSDLDLDFDPLCVRQQTNFASPNKAFLFDSPFVDTKEFRHLIQMSAPKLKTLIHNIKQLDRADKLKYGRTFKHFIFSDMKNGAYGSKIIASALMLQGFQLGVHAKLTKAGEEKAEEQKKNFDRKMAKLANGESPDDDDEEMSGGAKKAPLFSKIQLYDDATLARRPENFFVLTSGTMFGQPLSVGMKKEILGKFNKRPDNIYGKLARIIIMDGGYKEGIDLFDIKYVHIFEPQTTQADTKQVIGRGTRTCGQKGLQFHPNKGWPLRVFIYDVAIDNKMSFKFLNSHTAFEMYLKLLNVDLRLMNFANELENVEIMGSVDFELNKNIHGFKVDVREGSPETIKYRGFRTPSDRSQTHSRRRSFGGSSSPIWSRSRSQSPVSRSRSKSRSRSRSQSPTGTVVPVDDEDLLTRNMDDMEVSYKGVKRYIRKYYGRFAWKDVKVENLCGNEFQKKQAGGAPTIMSFTPTQDFVRHYFTPRNPVKGMLLHHSVGTGKTCSAIATATSTFEREGYTILWVTRTTLKNDIWKNMFDQVCSSVMKDRIERAGLNMPDKQSDRIKLLSKSWSIRPMSYKQFSNLVSGGNNMYKSLVKKNGAHDPLRKTLLIIDEAHKLYGGNDLSTIERPDMAKLHSSIMHSYKVSGNDSVRLLLMTATPVTVSPMELIQLLNLCKLPDKQIPDFFDGSAGFAKEFLNEMGNFTANGRKQFLNEIAGHISYLNRERDLRQFSQPIVQHIKVPMVSNEDMENILKYDTAFYREMMKRDMFQKRNNIKEEMEKVRAKFKFIRPRKSLAYLTKRCDKLPDDTAAEKKVKRYCVKTSKAIITKVSKKIMETKRNMREYLRNMRSDLKEARGQIKTRFAEAKDAKLRMNKKEIKTLKNTLIKPHLYFHLKNKCGKRAQTKEFDQHPVILDCKEGVLNHEDEIRLIKLEAADNVKANNARYRKTVKLLKAEMEKKKGDAIEVDRIKEDLAKLKNDVKDQNKIIAERRKHEIKNQMEAVNRNKYMCKTARRMLTKRYKEFDKQKKLQERALKAEQALLEKGKVNEYSQYKGVDNPDVKQMLKEAIAEGEANLKDFKVAIEQAARDKEDAKEQKAREKEEAKAEKAREKEEAKAEKAREKEEAKAQKAREKEEAKRQKELAKLAKKK